MRDTVFRLVDKSFCFLLGEAYTQRHKESLNVFKKLKDNKGLFKDKIVSDIHKKFHEFALKSILFKGRTDWYFCYLKSEKIAHVLSVLAQQSEVKERELAYKMSIAAAELPQTIAHFAAGEVDAAVVIADIFSLLSRVRLATTGGLLGNENGAILLNEYEALAERFSISLHPSPFTSIQDFSVSEIDTEDSPPKGAEGRLGEQQLLGTENNKGQTKGHISQEHKRQSERLEKILKFVRENAQSSIKDIASVIRNCSEKTIQRELGVLISQGLVKKIGERRWSVYVAI